MADDTPVARVVESEEPGKKSLARLERSLAAWRARGDASRLLAWLEKELDADGVPASSPVGEWGRYLAALAEACDGRPGNWPRAADKRIAGLVRAVLRFGRPSGAAMFGPAEVAEGRADALRFWAERLRDPALSRVVDDWFGSARAKRAARARSAPPLPADARTDRPLAILRPDWSPHGDFVAIDQRGRSERALVELAGLGQVWLGPTWDGAQGEPLDGSSPTVSRPRPVHWQTGPNADMAEWSFKAGGVRITRTAILFRGRQLALFAEQHEGTLPATAEVRLDLAEGVGAKTIDGSRALRLSAGRGRHAFAMPLGLPALAYPTERGSFEVEQAEAQSSQLVLRQKTSGRRAWLPLVVSWNPERDKRLAKWRTLTISKRWRVCTSDIAQAYRLGWGEKESLVVYRSLAKPDRRAFLGHITEARFLVGLFNKKGVLEPIVEVKDE